VGGEMTRSDAVREEVKRLDGYRCQVCGAGAETAVLEAAQSSATRLRTASRFAVSATTT